MRDPRDSSEIGEIIGQVSGKQLTRRSLLKGAAALGGVAALGPIVSACGEEKAADEGGGATGGEPNKGGTLRVGIVGGSAKDTADPHFAAFEADLTIEYQLYEGLTVFDFDANLTNAMAESIEPNEDGSVWQVKLVEGLTWHDGKPVTADDVVYSFERVVDPKNPGSGAATLSGLAPGGTVKTDDLTVEFRLETPNVLFPEALAYRGNMVVPVDFNPKKPIGSGPFKLTEFRPGEQFKFERFPEYRRGPAYLDAVTVTEFADETARVNALMSGDVDAISQLPTSQVKAIEGASLEVLNAETGAWRPFTMRIDVKPFDDLRVRQAFRLIVNRQEMIDHAYAGFGALGNDMYARFDPGTPDLPQREQDLEQAKSLLKQAGYDNNLTVQLVTSAEALGADEVAAAQIFAEQAKKAGVTVNLKKTDSATFYGKDYLSWPFAQDFWFTRGYLEQAGQGTMPGAPYNETHWKNDEWLALVKEAFTTVDEAKRNELVAKAQEIEYNEGGYIVWAWRNQVDAYSPKITGLKKDPMGMWLGRCDFTEVYFV